MLLGALLGLGARLDRVRDSIAATGLTGWRLECDTVDVEGLRATRASVHVRDPHTERHAAELLRHVRAAQPQPVADLAEHAVREIAGAEAELHGRSPDEVHLHEVGGLDTVVDTVGVAAALQDLGVTAVHSAPVALGSGTVDCAHGTLPAPAPATLSLLRGATVTGSELPGETVTPTGAALLRAARTRYEPPPSMEIQHTAYGAGTRRFPQRPNVLSATLGAPSRAAPSRAADSASMTLLECTVDDVSGETLGYVLDRALRTGASDAWLTPATMKKSRPGHVVHVLCESNLAEELREIVLAETGSLGIRSQHVQRHAVSRASDPVSVDGHPIRIKKGPWQSKPEHEDVVAAAGALGLPLREVVRRALVERHWPGDGAADPAD